MVPVVSIVGKKNSGKTKLIEGVVSELKRRGYAVGTIKHSVHHDIQLKNVDSEGTDTYRHYSAGADTVVLAGKQMLALFKRIEKPKTIDQIRMAYLSGLDIILTEGFKQEDKPKIEIVRTEVDEELLCSRSEDNLVAIVSDKKFELDIPCFELNDYAKVSDFLEKEFIKEDKAKEIGLVVDHKEIPLKGFIGGLIKEAILGMINSLHGIPENPQNIEIKIRR